MIKEHPVILLVDDDPNDMLFLKNAFAFIGSRAKIHTAQSGAEAIAYLKGEGVCANRMLHPLPDFILTDLKMPDGDGFSVLEFLKKNPETAVICASVLSGSQDNDDIKKAYWLGASSYHVKPSSLQELRRLVKILCDYWSLCEIPEKDATGRQLQSQSSHKLGERYSPDSLPVSFGHFG